MSISEAFEGVVPARKAQGKTRTEAPASAAKPRVAPADVTVELPAVTTQPRIAVRPLAARIHKDLTGAWLWDAAAPSPRALWAARIPDITSVPGENRALWAAWVTFNHVALVAGVALSVPIWLLGHPARTILTAVLAAPFLALWLL